MISIKGIRDWWEWFRGYPNAPRNPGSVVRIGPQTLAPYTVDYGLAVPSHLLEHHDEQWVNMISYLYSIKPFCRMGADIQEECSDYKLEENAEKFVEKNKNIFEKLKF